MEIEHGRTVWEKLGAAEGLWAMILLGLQFVVMFTTVADLGASDSEYATALLDERMQWEWVTFLRIVGGLMIIWWMGSLLARLRLVEGEPGRLATIAFGVGTVWGALWLVSAFFNSASILLAADYSNPVGSRVAGTLAIEAIYVLTPGIIVVLTFCTGLVALRFGGFPKWYAWSSFWGSGVFLVLAIADWYGPGSLSIVVTLLSLVWMGVTSGLLIPTYRTPDIIGGTKGRAAA